MQRCVTAQCYAVMRRAVPTNYIIVTDISMSYGNKQFFEGDEEYKQVGHTCNYAWREFLWHVTVYSSTLTIIATLRYKCSIIIHRNLGAAEIHFSFRTLMTKGHDIQNCIFFICP